MSQFVNPVEILAPVGSLESLAAALQAGADSVYFGVEQLNMRARSSNNFTLKDLGEIVQRCQSKQVKSYLTLNTILYDHDLQLMRRIVRSAKEAGIDAIIASDFALFQEAKDAGVPIHISTQANLSNIDAIAFMASFADVVVLARELNLSQVSSIAREIQRRKIVGPSGKLIRIEIFGHGALCMAVSGKCYLSLHSHFASANRGACIQNCRRPFIVTDKDEGFTYEIDNEYIMSAQDLCTIDFINEIMAAGVQVIKIEGRSRSPEYVYTVTRCYKEAVESVINGTYDQSKIDLWKNELTKVYNRGFWDGYYLGRKLGAWSAQYGSAATERKVYVGRGSKYYPRIQVGEFKIETGAIRKGDHLLIISPTSGITNCTLDTLVVNGMNKDEAGKGDHITFPVNYKIGSQDKLYKIVSNE